MAARDPAGPVERTHGRETAADRARGYLIHPGAVVTSL